MRALVQRVAQASVTVAEQVVGAIGPGLCVLVGVAQTDGPEQAARLADKVWRLRIFEDDRGQMNRSAADLDRSLLVVSQFTLYADTSRGRRPSFVEAARPEVAEPLIEAMIDSLRSAGATVATGVFRAHMEVALVNDGPVTIALEV